MKSRDDKVFDAITFIILALVAIVCFFPLMFVLAVSITPFSEVLKNGGFVLFPRAITFEAYHFLLTESKIIPAFGVTVFITIVGTIINLILTTLIAFPLSRKNLPGRSFFLLIVIFTMLFNGGIVPTYLIVKATGLINSIWAMIIPNAIWTFNILVMKSFFENLPNELFESARIDGAGEMRILWNIALPLSIPVMMTIGLFYGVGHWNQFFQAIMYITDTKLFPLQVVVRDILLQTQNTMENPDITLPTVTMQMAAVILASIPIILVYPFIQKHFTKGMLLGSVKG